MLRSLANRELGPATRAESAWTMRPASDGQSPTQRRSAPLAFGCHSRSRWSGRENRVGEQRTDRNCSGVDTAGLAVFGIRLRARVSEIGRCEDNTKLSAHTERSSCSRRSAKSESEERWRVRSRAERGEQSNAPSYRCSPSRRNMPSRLARAATEPPTQLTALASCFAGSTAKHLPRASRGLRVLTPPSRDSSNIAAILSMACSAVLAGLESILHAPQYLCLLQSGVRDKSRLDDGALNAT